MLSARGQVKPDRNVNAIRIAKFEYRSGPPAAPEAPVRTPSSSGFYTPITTKKPSRPWERCPYLPIR